MKHALYSTQDDSFGLTVCRKSWVDTYNSLLPTKSAVRPFAGITRVTLVTVSGKVVNNRKTINGWEPTSPATLDRRLVDGANSSTFSTVVVVSVIQ